MNRHKLSFIKLPIYFSLALLLLSIFSSNASAIRLKELATFEGVRVNQSIG
jgi:flagellar basal body P-ring protein FlgI